MRPRLYVDADYRLAQRAKGFEAGVAKFEAELVFAFCLECVMALVAGRVRRTPRLFSPVNFWMDVERVHKFSPRKYRCKRDTRAGYLFGLQRKDLGLVDRMRLCK